LRGVTMSAQGLAQRFTERAATFLAAVLAQAVRQVVCAPQAVSIELLQRFTAVWLLDSTVIGLPAALAARWPGTGGAYGSNAAAVKAEVGMDLLSGQLAGPYLLPGRTHEARGRLPEAAWPPGSLRVADLGYFSVPCMADLAAAGVYWLSRLRHDIALSVQGAPWDVAAHAAGRARQGRVQDEVAVGLGDLPARLLMQRVPEAVANERRRKLNESCTKKGRHPSQRSLALCDWTLLVTNVPADRLSLEEAMALYGARWQVELLFKLWKQHAGLATSVSQQPWRLLCEVYAKLLVVLLQHWLIVLGVWQQPAKSLVKAAQTVAAHAVALAEAFDSSARLHEAIAVLVRCLGHGCSQNRRKRSPNTWLTLMHGTPKWA
jgi:hypothetical protein